MTDHPAQPERSAATSSPTARRADEAARSHAVNPAENVVLEASAGTGKTRVLVDRYVNLLLAGVDPANILAVTFTRKAAAEMRQRIIQRLKSGSRTSRADDARWRELRPRLADIAISTIDAFCLSLLREFPLEADVEPGFELADSTEVVRLSGDALDRALRICRAQAASDEDVALVFAQLGERRLRRALFGLLERRLVAREVLQHCLRRWPGGLTAAVACSRTADRVRDVLRPACAGQGSFLRDGPCRAAAFSLLADDLRTLCGETPGDFRAAAGQAWLRLLLDRLSEYFLTRDGRPRGERFAGTGFSTSDCDSAEAWRRHRREAAAMAPAIGEAVRAYRRDLNVVLSRGVSRIFAVALAQYERALAAHARLDFTGVLERALGLLRQMDEFARSRYRLESRYRHVLVDEFQDTSRAQWGLVAQLVRSWGEGMGPASDAIPPSIFIVGDRKQSIYAFRDADVGLLGEAAEFVRALRPEGEPSRTIKVSSRSVPPLLSFVNDLFTEIAATSSGRDGTENQGSEFGSEVPGSGLTPADRVTGREMFRYDDRDRFPVDEDGSEARTAGSDVAAEEPIGIIVGESVSAAAENVADEVARLLSGSVVRDRLTGARRPAEPADIAVLFRSRDSHRQFEAALERRGVPTYVYRGLGFFEADEVQDALALLRYLADPESDLRAAAFLRSRIVRLSDEGLARLAPGLAASLYATLPAAFGSLSAEDERVLTRTREAVARWTDMVDRVPAVDLLDLALRESAYGFELRGARRVQSRENLKKLRGLVRRIQNRGYATLARIADTLGRSAVGDESNAIVDAVDAVSLLTAHAAKGLEFPIVFVVNLGRGSGGASDPIRVSALGEPSIAVADYQSEADEDAAARGREETKRLLYVALTRARDRLYLSTTVRSGESRMMRGSLGEVLPKSFLRVFVEAAVLPGDSGRKLVWTPVHGRFHTFLVPSSCAGPSQSVAPSVEVAAALLDDFGPVDDDTAVRRVPVVENVIENAGSPASLGAVERPVLESGADSLLSGTLTHKLFPLAMATDEPALRARAADVCHDAPGATEVDRERAIRLALGFARRLRELPALAEPIAGGRVLYELPFSTTLDDRTILRGSMDCVILGSTGSVTVVEIKTGARRPEHAAQLEQYVSAARVLFPNAHVDGLLMYADE